MNCVENKLGNHKHVLNVNAPSRFGLDYFHVPPHPCRSLLRLQSQRAPQQFTLDEEIYEIAAVLDQWYEPSATYFKVQSTEGKTYLLRYDEQADEWTLQSGLDGDELLGRPSIQIVTVDFATAKKAVQQIVSCEQCHPEDAETIRLDSVGRDQQTRAI